MVVGSRTSCEPTRIWLPPFLPPAAVLGYFSPRTLRKRGRSFTTPRGRIRAVPGPCEGDDAPVDGHAAGGGGQDRVEVKLGDLGHGHHEVAHGGDDSGQAVEVDRFPAPGSDHFGV